ncbi:MAG: dihydrofolate reductase family protein, partial [Candidatus Eiseniibacteriota bacterium]
REVRAPWERKGGTTFHFVNDGMESALRKARAAAGDKDVRISGGANVVMQYLNAGLVDELQLAIAPMLMGDGLRLFDSLVPRRIELKLIEAIPSAGVTHVRYAVSRAKTGI